MTHSALIRVSGDGAQWSGRWRCEDHQRGGALTFPRIPSHPQSRPAHASAHRPSSEGARGTPSLRQQLREREREAV
jgi:hypothetical protein